MKLSSKSGEVTSRQAFQ